MHVDYLIIGQGISGTWLSYFLEKENASFIVIDNNDPLASSRIAAGIINPVTGRRHVTVWMAEIILPFAEKHYKELGSFLDQKLISTKSLIDFFPSPQMRENFLQRAAEDNQYVHSFPEQNQFNPLFRYDFGCGEIRPVYLVHLENLLPAWRTHLKVQDKLVEAHFDIAELYFKNNKVYYKDIIAEKIIFCDGHSASFHSYFEGLPFAPNKGEFLTVRIPDLPPHHIYKKGMMLVPMETAGHFWVGSTYTWNFAHADPTQEFKVRTQQWLMETLKLPFEILEHQAGIRPATLERRPFVGMHPVHPRVGILNGMGTKGCSLAPFFAKELAFHLCYKETLTPEANIDRLRKILSRNSTNNR